MTETIDRPDTQDATTSADRGIARARGVTPTVAVVTGASSGIGKELARLLLQDGWTVVAAAEDPSIMMAAEELSRDGGEGRVETVQVDLSSAEGVEQLWERATAGGGREVDLVALNAGVGAGGRSFVEIPLEEDLQVVALNVTSTVHLAKLAAREMHQRGSGRLLFTSSIAATMPAPYQATYGASKAFVQSLAEALRGELAGRGVVVTALQPGPTDTNFFRRARMQASTRVGRGPKDDPAKVARQGYEAVLGGSDRVVAGNPLNTVQEAAARVMPDRVRAAMHAVLTKPQGGAGEQG
ncbi:MAG: SDR family NAD(P)-dependent oxidoreductase [Candidatus Nanopelagicales bacterium]|jgi:short-subunit dehydrogenase|nr:SDR family NAD(P)-dependent oxidoreductase [Candidatus Nanopelagicales bacterium]